MMRRRGPGLIRTATRTAVVAGTAIAGSGSVAHRQPERYAQEEAQREAQYAYSAPPPPAAEPSYASELEQLAHMQAQGIITDEEFQAKKKQLLGI